MRAGLHRPVLVAATLVSAFLGTGHGIHDAQAAGSVVLVIAFGKAGIVARQSMELRHAPRRLRGLVDGVLAVCATALVTLLLVA